MTATRHIVLAGMAGGMVWALLAVFALPPLSATGDPLRAVAVALLGPALVLTLMIGRLAQRRFFDDAIIDGDALPTGSSAAVDGRVLANTVEQTALALCVWPALALADPEGPGIVAGLGVSFVLARLLFWVGYHRAPALRGLGFAATFYTTVLAGLRAGWAMANG